MFAFTSTIIRILISFFTALVNFFTAVGGFVTGNGIYSDTIIYTDRFGYNDCSSEYYCYLSFDSKGIRADRVNLYNLDSDNVTVIYEAAGSDEYISMQQVDGETASYVVWRDGEATKYYYEIGTGELTSEPFYYESSTSYILDTSAKVDMRDAGKVYFNKKFGDEELYYSVDGTDFQLVNGAKFRTRSMVTDSQFTYEDGVVYGVITEYKGILTGPQTFTSPDRAKCSTISKEVFFSFDPETGEYNKLYTTPNAYTRVIGYHDGFVYLWNRNKIIKRDLATGQKAVLDSIETKEKVRFAWAGNRLIVFDDIDGEVEKIIEE